MLCSVRMRVVPAEKAELVTRDGMVSHGGGNGMNGTSVLSACRVTSADPDPEGASGGVAGCDWLSTRKL